MTVWRVIVSNFKTIIMIKANELRIGNYVGISWNNTYSKIQEITTEDVTVQSGFPSYEQLKPIPITEKWLLKFGFEIDKDMGWWSNIEDKSGLLVLGDNDDGFSVEFYYSFLELKYVHQLQNLYFALTNEELTLND